MDKAAFIVAGIMLFVAVASGPPALAESSIECAELDPVGEFLDRSVSVSTESGQRFKGVVSLRLSANTDVLSFADFAGKKSELPLSEFRSIEVARQVHQQSNAAQEAPWTIEITMVEPVSKEVPIANVVIEDGLIRFGTADPCLTDADGRTLEIDTITYNDDARTLSIEGEFVKFEKIHSGGGPGNSFGFGKG